MSVENQLIDMSYILDISGGDPMYMYDITGIFLETMLSGLPKLKQLIDENDDFEKIHKQAHYLKSSAGIIKIRNNYESLIRIDTLAQQKTNMDEIMELFHSISANFEEALPLLNEIRDNNKPAE
jgi:HPt (histidine-containing phosphotransfer) domain-containing protein